MPSLTTIASDLQITICTFLHPFDILALRQTCTVLRLATKRRIIWIDALHRVCLDNTLFLPSFPIPDMSDVELEQASIAPRRWIKRCAMFARQHPYRSDEILCPTTTRTIWDPFTELDTRVFLVPGGRYLVGYSPHKCGIWDLGYTYSMDCKLLASVEKEGGFRSCVVGATSDGMGLIIVGFGVLNTYSSIYEIYPQNETPQFTRIAIAVLDRQPYLHYPPYLSPNRLLWYYYNQENELVFRVWEYRLNHSTAFTLDVDVEKLGNIQVIVTKTMIIALCVDGIIASVIPPLSPQPLDISSCNSTRIPWLFRIPYPVDTIRRNISVKWRNICSWYSESSQTLHLDAICGDLKLHEFEIVIEPDLSNLSLHLMNTSQVTSYYSNYLAFEPYRICEDILFSCYDDLQSDERGVYTRSMSTRPADIVSPDLVPLGGWYAVKWSPSLCPASGRVVYMSSGRIIVIHCCGGTIL